MERTNDIMHIVYASDDNFAEIMGVSIVSLFENNKDTEDIVLYIFDSGISDINKKNINDISKKYNRSLPVWITAKNISDELKIDVSMDRGSLSQYARLFVSSLLPESVKRVIYLDCDIIIDKSIKELWQLDMQGMTIAALMDAFSRQYRRNINLKPDDIMFNSGVMLIDMDKWKERDIEKKLLDFIVSKKGVIQQGDQGALNSILSKETYCFDPSYNSETVFYDFNYKEMMIYRKPPKFYSEAEIKNAVENPVMIHFTTSFLSERPLIKGSKHIYADKWLYYKGLSPWKDSPLWEPKKRSPLKKVLFGVMKIMPRFMIVRLSGILHRYGRPLFYRIKS